MSSSQRHSPSAHAPCTLPTVFSRLHIFFYSPVYWMRQLRPSKVKSNFLKVTEEAKRKLDSRTHSKCPRSTTSQLPREKAASSLHTIHQDRETRRKPHPRACAWGFLFSSPPGCFPEAGVFSVVSPYSTVSTSLHCWHPGRGDPRR